MIDGDMSETHFFDGLPVIEKRTAPTVAKAIFEAGNIDFLEIPGWENRTDEALIRTQMPDSGVLREAPDDSSPDFHPIRLPSQGRVDTVLLAKPAIVEGKKYGALMRKGVGTEPTKLNEQGEVFGTPKKGEDTSKATYGFAVVQQCIEEKDISEEWERSGLRIRKTIKVFDLQEVTMMSGMTHVNELPYEEAKLAGEVVYGTRNPITFEDAIQFFQKANSKEEQKAVADRLLSVCGKFLAMTDDAATNQELVALLESGDPRGEAKWFEFLASGYGKQMMQKTERGLYHSEMHRQNNYLGIENADFADHGTANERETPWDLGSYREAKMKRKDKLLIREVSEVLTQNIDLKINFNLANNRSWNDDFDSVVEQFVAGMRDENTPHFDEVLTKVRGDFLRMTYQGRSYNKLWGPSSLTFIDDNNTQDESLSPVRTGTPGKPSVLSLVIAEELGKYVDKASGPEEDINRLLSYQAMFSEEEGLEFVEEYSHLLDDPNFLLTQNKWLDGVVALLEKGPINPNLVIGHSLSTEDALDGGFSKDNYGRVFMIESGLMREVGNIIALQPSERRSYVQNLNLQPKRYDLESIRNYVNNLE